MSTNIRMPEDLKARAAKAADRVCMTLHDFMLEAIVEKVEEVERAGGLHDEAEKRFARILETGKTIPWAEMRRHLERRLHGKKLRRP
jgi:uncharacterized protein (DUF1778 family)